MDGKFVSDFLVTLVVLLAVFVALILVFVANTLGHKATGVGSPENTIYPLNLRGELPSFTPPLLSPVPHSSCKRQDSSTVSPHVCQFVGE